MFQFHYYVFLVEPILEEDTAWIRFLLHSFENEYLLVIFAGNKMQDTLVGLYLLILERKKVQLHSHLLDAFYKTLKHLLYFHHAFFRMEVAVDFVL